MTFWDGTDQRKLLDEILSQCVWRKFGKCRWLRMDPGNWEPTARSCSCSLVLVSRKCLPVRGTSAHGTAASQSAWQILPVPLLLGARLSDSPTLRNPFVWYLQDNQRGDGVAFAPPHLRIEADFKEEFTHLTIIATCASLQKTSTGLIWLVMCQISG